MVAALRERGAVVLAHVVLGELRVLPAEKDLFTVRVVGDDAADMLDNDSPAGHGGQVADTGDRRRSGREVDVNREVRPDIDRLPRRLVGFSPNPALPGSKLSGRLAIASYNRAWSFQVLALARRHRARCLAACQA